MLRRIILVLFLIPLAIALIALTVANRQMVGFSIDVFNPGSAALTATAPFFVWLYAALGVGIIIGGIGTWLTQGKHRKHERQLKKEADKLRYEMEDTRRKAGIEATTPGSSLIMRNGQ